MARTTPPRGTLTTCSRTMLTGKLLTTHGTTTTTVQYRMTTTRGIMTTTATARTRRTMVRARKANRYIVLMVGDRYPDPDSSVIC